MTEQQISLKQKLPQNVEAEEAVLGSVLIDGECLGEIEFLTSGDFYIQRNGWIYQACQDLRRQGQAVDYLTVCTELERIGKLNEIGGPARVMELINRTPSSINAVSYARLVKDEANRRRLLQVANDLANAAFDHQRNLEAAVGDGLDRLSRSLSNGSGAIHISHYLEQVNDEVQAAYQHPYEDETWGIPTGLKDWDYLTGGLQLGEVVKLTGEPGVGKSLLAMQILCCAAEKGYPGVIYELEMGGKQVVRRSLSMYTQTMNQSEHFRQLTTRAMRNGKITVEQMAAFNQALKHMARLPIYISDNSYMTTAAMRVDLIRLIEHFGVQVCVIDYEGLLQDEAKDRVEHSVIVSDRVHAMIKELNLACISIGDMTKEGVQGKVQGQGAMAGTARELHNADAIVLMRRKDNNLVRLTWEKLREGDGDRGFDLLKLSGFPIFGELKKERSK